MLFKDNYTKQLFRQLMEAVWAPPYNLFPEILRDKTMNEKFMHIPQERQNCPTIYQIFWRFPAYCLATTKNTAPTLNFS